MFHRCTIARFVLCLPLVPLPGCASTGGSMQDVFGGKQAISVVSAPEYVQAWRMPPKSYRKESLDDYTYTAGPIVVAPADAKQLRKVLLNRSTYGWGYAKACLPDYGVRIQFVDKDHTVDVLFCFECDILTVFHDGKQAGGEDFDDGRPVLVDIMKRLFPDDQAIQGLSRIRP